MRTCLLAALCVVSGWWSLISCPLAGMVCPPAAAVQHKLLLLKPCLIAKYSQVAVLLPSIYASCWVVCAMAVSSECVSLSLPAPAPLLSLLLCCCLFPLLAGSSSPVFRLFAVFRSFLLLLPLLPSRCRAKMFSPKQKFFSVLYLHFLSFPVACLPLFPLSASVFLVEPMQCNEWLRVSHANRRKKKDTKRKSWETDLCLAAFACAVLAIGGEESDNSKRGLECWRMNEWPWSIPSVDHCYVHL